MCHNGSGVLILIGSVRGGSRQQISGGPENPHTKRAVKIWGRVLKGVSCT